MYCVKCGHTADDDNVYCARCGAKLQKPIIVPDDEEFDENVTPSRSVTTNRAKPFLLIGAGAVMLIALLLIILNFATVKNWFVRTASSPEDLLLLAYKNSLSTAFSPVMDNYEEVLSKGNQTNVCHQSEITLKPGRQITDKLVEAIASGEDDASWLSEIRFHVDYAVHEKLQKNVCTFGLGQQDICSVEMVTDFSGEKRYITIPELNPQSLITDTEQGFPIVSSNREKLYEAMPSRQVLENITVRYLDILLSGFSNVEKYSETMTLDGISQKVTVLEAYFDHADLLEVYAAVLEQLKADEDIREVLENFNPWYNDLMEQSMGSYDDYFGVDYEPMDLYEELMAEVDEALEQLQDAFKTADPKNYIYLYTYLDDSNQIIGTKLMISDMEDPLSTLTLSEDNQYVSEILIGNLQIRGSGPVSDSLTGSFTISVDNEKLFDMKAENVTASKGTVYLEPSAVMLKTFAEEMGMDANTVSMADIVLCVCFEESDSDSQCEVSVLSNEMLIMELIISNKISESAEILLPDNAVHADDEQSLSNWFERCSLEMLYSNLEDAGVPEEIVRALLTDTSE